MGPLCMRHTSHCCQDRLEVARGTQHSLLQSGLAQYSSFFIQLSSHRGAFQQEATDERQGLRAWRGSSVYWLQLAPACKVNFAEAGPARLHAAGGGAGQDHAGRSGTARPLGALPQKDLANVSVHYFWLEVTARRLTACVPLLSPTGWADSTRARACWGVTAGPY